MDFLWSLAAKQSGVNLQAGHLRRDEKVSDSLRSSWQKLQEEASALWSFGDSSPSATGPTATTTTTTGSLTDSLDVSPLTELFEDPWGFDTLAKEAQEAHEAKEASKACPMPRPDERHVADYVFEARQAAVTTQLSECLLRLEVDSVEVTEIPYCVYFQILVDHLGSGRSHTVMKTHLDLAGLQAALCDELPSVRLPPLPCPNASLPLTSPSFRVNLGEYLLSICSSRDLARSQAVRNFFHLTDDYQRTPRRPAATPRSPFRTPPREFRTPRAGVTPRRATPRRGACSAEPQLATPKILEADDVDPTPAQKEQEARSALDQAVSVKLQNLMRPLGRTTDSRPGPSRSDLHEGSGQLPKSSSISKVNGTSVSPKLGARYLLPAVTSPALKTRPSSSSQSTLADTPSPSPCKTHGVLAQYPDQRDMDHEDRRSRHTYCVICWGAKTDTAIDPCGHLCLCASCAASVNSCPVCRGPVGKLLKVFIP